MNKSLIDQAIATDLLNYLDYFWDVLDLNKLIIRNSTPFPLKTPSI